MTEAKRSTLSCPLRSSWSSRSCSMAHLTAYRKKRPTNRPSSCCPLKQRVLLYHTQQQLRVLHQNRTSNIQICGLELSHFFGHCTSLFCSLVSLIYNGVVMNKCGFHSPCFAASFVLYSECPSWIWWRLLLMLLCTWHKPLIRNGSGNGGSLCRLLWFPPAPLAGPNVRHTFVFICLTFF